ncbi:MAG TPA: hypothetical protein VGN88_10935 [Phycisphaerae bacterium]
MKPLHRSLLAAGLMLPLAALLLVTFACLPVPIGDPEKSKVDPALAGIYKAIPKDTADKSSTLALLQAWDDKTYLLTYMSVQKGDKQDDLAINHFKGWLTTIEGKTFITLKPMDDPAPVIGDAPDKPFWVVLRLDKTATGMQAFMVNPDAEIFKGLTKQEEFEAAIKAHVSDKATYSDPLEFKKLGKDDKAMIDDVMSKFNTKK